LLILAVPSPKTPGRQRRAWATGLEIASAYLRGAIAGRCGCRQSTPAHRTDRRLETGGVHGHREVGRVTCCAEERGREAPHMLGAGQEVVVTDKTGRAIAASLANRPNGRSQYKGRQKPRRRGGPSLPKTVRHPTDAAEVEQIPGERPTFPSSPTPSR